MADHPGSHIPKTNSAKKVAKKVAKKAVKKVAKKKAKKKSSNTQPNSPALGSRLSVTSDAEREKRFQIENAFDTLVKAEDLKKDKKLMAEVQKLKKQKLESLKSI